VVKIDGEHGRRVANVSAQQFTGWQSPKHCRGIERTNGQMCAAQLQSRNCTACANHLYTLHIIAVPYIHISRIITYNQYVMQSVQSKVIIMKLLYSY